MSSEVLFERCCVWMTEEICSEAFGIERENHHQQTLGKLGKREELNDRKKSSLIQLSILLWHRSFYFTEFPPIQKTKTKSFLRLQAAPAFSICNVNVTQLLFCLLDSENCNCKQTNIECKHKIKCETCTFITFFSPSFNAALDGSSSSLCFDYNLHHRRQPSTFLLRFHFLRNWLKMRLQWKML